MFLKQGETMKTIDVYANNSAEILNEFEAVKEADKSKICAVFLNYNKNSKLCKMLSDKGFTTISFENFVKKILSKTTKFLGWKNISDFTAMQIISSLAKSCLAGHSALKNLIKSESFPRELYNLFGVFKINKIAYDDLILAASSADVAEDDKNRFEIVAKIYDEYCKFLLQQRFLDFRDVILTTIEELENNDLLKNFVQKNFGRLYVFGAENLSVIQLDLLKTVVGIENLTLVGDKNAKIHTFMGANAFDSDFDVDLSKMPVNTLSPLNEDIYKRAIYMKKSSVEKIDFKKTSSLEYRLFSDLKDEVEYIAKTIIDGVKHGEKYSDYAILTRDNSVTDSIVDVLKKFEIPVNGKLFSENFEVFKVQFERILMMCEIFAKLGVEDFSNLENISTKSRVELENATEQLNLLTENFLYEILENKYDAEKLLSLQTREKYRFLLSAALQNLSILSDIDAKKFKNEITNLRQYYSLYLSGNYVAIVAKIVNILEISDENFHKFLAKFLTDLKEISSLKTDVLKEKLGMKSVLNLMQADLQENIETDNKINLMSIFKSSAQNFKTVFLPALSENYFPKKTKSTYFISDDANIKISDNLRKKFNNFEKLISSQEDELKDENSLLYTAFTRAENKIMLSAHKYSDRQQIAPSSYFEHFLFVDGENFVSDETEKLDTEIKQSVEVEEKEIEKKPKQPVLSVNEPIRLSASSINKFLKCPRNFYYSKLLGLKTTSSFTASYGTAVHAVFELVMKSYIKDFSKDIFLKLGNILFDVKKDRKSAIDVGFDEVKVVGEIEKLSDLGLEEMRTDFLNAMDNLETIGYFEEKPLACDCEKPFGFTMEELPTVTFNGFIDAIIQYESGWKLLDYKTSADKPALGYLFSENGVNFSSEKKGVYNESYIKKYDYQIPLYYLACLHSADLENYKTNLDEVGYLYVRPKNHKNGESRKDYMPVSQIQQYQQKIVENIKTTVVDKIYEKSDFEPIYDPISCKYCDFKEYCNGKTNGGEA